MNSKFQVLLYYKYISISNPEKVRDQQRLLCESLNLKGRIIVAKEGINGTVEGLIEDTEKYIQTMGKSRYFKDISYKSSPGNGYAFPKLSVKARDEIVAARLPDINPNQISGKYLAAEDLHQWFEEGREFFVVDMRNDYEQESGYFANSILSGIHNFFDLPHVLPKLNHLKGKTIVTVCTGGVRCEKASGFLIENGFEKVYQLKDGIQSYLEKYPNQHFKGALYVFDNRLTIRFGATDSDQEIVGRCMHCKKSCESYTNCAYDFCHLHYICCQNCKDQELNLAFCKAECKDEFLQHKPIV